jgi:hypothetical protein
MIIQEWHNVPTNPPLKWTLLFSKLFAQVNQKDIDPAFQQISAREFYTILNWAESFVKQGMPLGSLNDRFSLAPAYVKAILAKIKLQ